MEKKVYFDTINGVLIIQLTIVERNIKLVAGDIEND